MRSFQTFRREWLTHIPTELLSGTPVALALIPEAIGFSIVAGVDPKIASMRRSRSASRPSGLPMTAR